MSFYLRKYMWLISLLAVVVCSYFLARLSANMIATKFSSAENLVGTSMIQSAVEESVNVIRDEDLKLILERNIFDSKAVPPGQKVEGAETSDTAEEEFVATGEAVLTGLKIKLISTFSVGEGLDERSTCIVSTGGRDGQQVYTVNDKKQFSPDTKITKILNTKIEFINKGRLEYLELEDYAKGVDLNKPPQRESAVVKETKGSDEEVKVEKKGEGSFVIDRSEIDNAIANLDKLYTQVRAVPHFKDGKPDGLKLLSVRADSIFGKLGLKRGDVLQKINGMDLDIKRGLEIFNQLKTENHISIEIERQDKPVTQEYDIR